jgi:hypothetical protein
MYRPANIPVDGFSVAWIHTWGHLSTDRVRQLSLATDTLVFSLFHDNLPGYTFKAGINGKQFCVLLFAFWDSTDIIIQSGVAVLYGRL